ncbi:hypothetical protein A2791_05345 [Candidatus Saccharibacteria bacterium RIFCSPHIGHO2_01_FULL_46_30]|nr:MAG: hypothetical protein A2791_05345 [Candidatus Saccharibacteria bacterium RIFCSPHIGHO2_01_FULL_46_30]
MNETPSQKTEETIKLPWRRLLRFATGLKLRFFVAGVTGIIAAAAGLIFPLVIGQGIASVIDSGSYDELNILALGLLGLFVIQAVAQFFQTYYLSYIGETIVYRLRKKLFAKLLANDAPFYATHKSGELSSRLSNDTTTLQSIFSELIPNAALSVLTLIATVVIMIGLNPQLTLFVFATLPFIIVVAIVVGRKIQKLGLKGQDQLADTTSMATEVFKNMSIVKAFTAESYEEKRYNTKLAALFQTLLHSSKFNALGMALITFLGFSTIAAIVWFAGRQAIEGALTVGLITTFLIYGIQIAADLGQLSMIFGRFKQASGASKRIFDLLDYKNTFKESGSKDISVTPEITLSGVSFGYSDIAVLHDISFTVPAGKIIALVGPSGAGKSTIFELLQRFYEPTSGTITFGNTNILDIDPKTLRSSIGVVSQQAPLFSGTIRDNIAYGNFSATDDQIIAAAKAAEAHDFIKNLEKGYDTVLSEGGNGLSGGQRQRVSIARAIIKNAPILLLDEATSALDNASERRVQKAITKLMQGRTTLIIAHRLSTIEHADKIIVVSNGHIVEEGTHAELLKQGKLYSDLYTQQD